MYMLMVKKVRFGHLQNKFQERQNIQDQQGVVELDLFLQLKFQILGMAKIHANVSKKQTEDGPDT